MEFSIRAPRQHVQQESVNSIRQVPRNLSHPPIVGLLRDPCDMDSPRRQIHHEEHVVANEPVEHENLDGAFKLFEKDTVLFPKVIDLVLLLAVDPTGEDQQEKLQCWRYRFHAPVRTPLPLNRSRTFCPPCRRLSVDREQGMIMRIA